MKILMVSLFAPHFFNWTEQLRNSHHEIYWLDVYDSNTPVTQIDFVNQITGWRHKWNYPGRYFLKSKTPALYKFINRFNERQLTKVLEQKIKEIKPDVVHSFVMYISGVPILPLMRKYPAIKWILSSWGSDLFYYRNINEHKKGMNLVFPRLDYMFTDCFRDQSIARQEGFTGKFIGVFPGGGGFDFSTLDPLMQNINQRNLILIKGYQGLHGRCIPVLKALEKKNQLFQNFQITVIGAEKEVLEYLKNSPLLNWTNFTVFGKISRNRVMELMGKSLLYIGNSKSDGMPNTLLEAIVMGVFPIQSNPGEVTGEVIRDNFNGCLIEDPENVEEISGILDRVLFSDFDIGTGVQHNLTEVKPTLGRVEIERKVLKAYEKVEEELMKA